MDAQSIAENIGLSLKETDDRVQNIAKSIMSVPTGQRLSYAIECRNTMLDDGAYLDGYIWDRVIAIIEDEESDTFKNSDLPGSRSIGDDQ